MFLVNSVPIQAYIELDRKKIIAVIDTTFAVVKRKPEKKIRLARDSNPMTSAIPVQRSNQLSWSFGRFFINP